MGVAIGDVTLGEVTAWSGFLSAVFLTVTVSLALHGCATDEDPTHVTAIQCHAICKGAGEAWTLDRDGVGPCHCFCAGGR